MAKLCPELGLIHLISSIKHNKPAKFFGYFPDGKRKGANDDTYRVRRVVRPLESQHISNLHNAHDISQYMNIPTDDQRKDCYRAFYEATGSDAVAIATCGICAREVGLSLVIPMVVRRCRHKFGTVLYLKQIYKVSRQKEIKNIAIRSSLVADTAGREHTAPKTKNYIERHHSCLFNPEFVDELSNNQQ